MRLIETSSTPGSLRWDGDELVDAAGAFRRWTADGVEHASRFGYGSEIDRAVHSPSGRWTVVYEERGTKALLLDGEKIARELNRSCYQAENYDYPVALGILPDGREVLVHCPDAYNVLEIEDIASGVRLTAGSRTPRDFFHSRLAVSPDGRRLLSAGWVWSPVGLASAYDLEAALTDPSLLDGQGAPGNTALDAEVGAACWLDADRLAVAATVEGLGDEGDRQALRVRELGVWSCTEGRWLHRSPSTGDWGTLVPCGGNRVLSLYGHPRLVDATDGTVLAEWPDVAVSSREGAFGVTHVPSPVTALHGDGTRVAVAVEKGIAVLGLPA
ncbi:hypothetical protein OG625_11690 [Streptomyces sp. NBC_01351]|uniref:hypothetical protein n=1 Tax=Streptomyces sp. NBC_01351 TaxID=2903833 RepID=UPI002E357B9C|nr:hypothetical protein [Streptomyces sp. NBC_01351]